MAGLLDDVATWVGGDYTTKDDSGLTEQDRRQPIWSGLLRGGAQLIAAGQRMPDNERAKYLAQAGEAYAGIPGEMIKQRSEMAQNVLKQQQVQAGKAKLGTLQKMRDWAASAEGQTAFASLKPHQQFAAKVALDSGDVDAFAKVMSGIESAEIAHQRATIAQQLADLKIQQAEGAGGWKGTAADTQSLNKMDKGDKDEAYRASFDYAQAYNQLAMGKVTYNAAGDVIDVQPRNMGLYKVPTHPSWNPSQAVPPNRGAPAQPPAPGGGPAVPPAVPTPPVAVAPNAGGAGAGEPTQPPVVAPPVAAPGPVVAPGPTPGPGPAVAPPAPGTVRPAVTVPTTGGGQVTVTQVRPKEIPREEIAKFNNHKVEANTLIAAMEDWRNEVRAATGGDKLAAVTGITNNLTTSAGLSMMLSKGTSLLELGVLNGKDLEVIQSILPDPKTFKGTLADVESAIDKVKSIVQYRLDLRESLMLGKPEPQVPALMKRAEQEANAKMVEYTTPDGRPVTNAQINDTAKKNSMTRDAVIADLIAKGKLKKREQ